MEKDLYLDELTGLYNRRYLKERLAEEVENASRTNHRFSLVMMDIDYFKEINDTYGHLSGDRAIIETANLLLTSVRKEDVVFRFAGDEFMILFPNLDANTVYPIAQRIVEEARRREVETAEGKRMKFTFSLGIAEFPEDGSNPESLTHFADQALYARKQRGRNGICGREEVQEDLKKKAKVFQVSFCPKTVGREKEFSRLKELLDGAKKGGGGVVFLSGEEGVGKSRLTNQLKEITGEEGGITLTGRCTKEGVSTSYQPFRDAILSWVRSKTNGVGVQSASGGEPLQVFQQMEEIYRGELLNLIPDLESLGISRIELPSLSPKEAQVRLFNAVLKFLLGVGGANGNSHLLLILEDLHWADGASGDLLHFLARNIRNSPILILGTYRPEEQESLIIGTMEKMRQERLTQSIHLERLTPDDVNQMIRLILQVREVPVLFSKRIFEETEGNPFFIEEIVKSLVEDGIITQAADLREEKTLMELKLPGAMKEVVEKRVSLLSSTAQGALAWGATIGERFDFELLLSVSSLNEGQLFELLEQALRAQLIREEFIPGKDLYSFTHAKIQDVIYEGISPRRKKRYHETVATEIEKMYQSILDSGSCGEGVCSLLTHHYGLGENWEKSLDYAMKAGVHAKGVYANRDAIRYFEKAKAMLEGEKLTREDSWKDEKKVALVMELGEIYLLIGQYEKALSEFGLMEKTSLTMGDEKKRGKALVKRGEVYRLQGNFDEAMIHSKNSFEVYKKTDDPQGLADSLVNIGVVHGSQGEFESALKCFEESLKIRREIGEKRDVAWTLGHIGAVHGNRGDYEEALKHFDESLVVRREIGDKRGEASSLINIGLVHWNRGNYEEALVRFEEALKIQREIGDKKNEAVCLNSIGNVHLNQGEYGKAFKWYEKSLTIQREIGDQWGMAYALQNIGVVHWFSGEYPDSLKCFEESLTIRQKIGDKTGISMSLNNIGDVYRILGDYESALKCFEEFLKIRKETGDKKNTATTLKNIGDIHTYRGNYGKALECFEEALKIQKETQSKKSIAETLTSTGILYRSLYDTEKALEVHQESLALAKEIGAKDEEARVYTAIGTDYYMTGDFDKSIQYLTDASNRSLDLGLMEHEPEILSILSQVWLSMEDSARASEFCRILLEKAELRGLKGYLARGRKIKGEILLTVAVGSSSSRERPVAVAVGSSSSSSSDKAGVRDQGSGVSENTVAEAVGSGSLTEKLLREAETELKEALRIAEEIGAKPLQWQIHTSLGKLYQSPLFYSPLSKGGIERGVQHLDESVGAGLKPAPTQAKEHYTKAKEIIEEIASTIGKEEIKTIFLNAKPIQTILQDASKIERSLEQPNPHFRP